jgi:hypothetical protein
MNNQLINWKSILLSFAKQFLRCAKEKGEQAEKAINCFVIDDTTIEKAGTTFEGISKVFNHVSRTYLFGFKLLILALWVGCSNRAYFFSSNFNKKQGVFH